MLHCPTRTTIMSHLFATVLVLFLSHGALAGEDAPKKTIINVDLYYEALCGDSMRFFKNQLVPSYPNLADNLKINFIPYGKATHVWDAKNERWSFMCQHGPAECRANRAQACALDAIEKNEKSDNLQELSFKLIGCVMTSSDPGTAVSRCGSFVNLSRVTRRMISDCEETVLSDDLLVAYGNKTHSLEPPLSFVPTIVINGTPNSENQSAALTDFNKLICGLIPENEKPDSCKSL